MKSPSNYEFVKTEKDDEDFKALLNVGFEIMFMSMMLLR